MAVNQTDVSKKSESADSIVMKIEKINKQLPGEIFEKPQNKVY